MGKTKTTVMLPGQLLVAAKRRAAEEGCSLGTLIERGLRHELLGRTPAGAPKRRRIHWVTVAGGLPRDLNTRDRAAMHDWLRRR
jgi:hypothetical protein